MTGSRLILHLARLPQGFDELRLAALAVLFLWLNAQTALAGRAKPLVKVS